MIGELISLRNPRFEVSIYVAIAGVIAHKWIQTPLLRLIPAMILLYLLVEVWLRGYGRMYYVILMYESAWFFHPKLFYLLCTVPFILISFGIMEWLKARNVGGWVNYIKQGQFWRDA